MIKLIPIQEADLKKAIRVGFSDDARLFEFYHDIAEPTLDNCIEHTFGEIRELIRVSEGVTLYKVSMRGNDIGYTVIIKNARNVLYSFAINGKFRSMEIKLWWLNAIDKKFRQPYFVKLENKNARAIGFFRKSGFEVMPKLSDDKHTTLLCI